MPTPTVDDHTEDFEKLAGLYALAVLEGDELARFEEHSTRCERCQLMVRLDVETLARVSLAAPAMDASPDFKARLMRRAAEELEQQASAPSSATATPHLAAEPSVRQAQHERQTYDPAHPEAVEGAEPTQLRPRPANVVPFWRRSPWMSALAAVLIVAIVTVGAFTYENQAVATYELTGSVPGSARVVVRRSGAAELDMNGLPNPEPGFVYEAWIIPPGTDTKPVAAGTTTTGEAKLPLPGDVRGTTVAITKERGRVDAPTSDPILFTVVQS
jgi:anti-sigma-K factor RskA